MEEIVINNPVLTLELINQALKSSVLDVAFIILILTIIVDIVTGYVKNMKYHTSDSSAGIKGLIKHSTVIFVCFIISFSILLIGNTYITVFGNVLISLFTIEYIKSVAENLAVLGFKYPKMMSSKVENEIAEKLKLKEEAQKLKEERTK